MEEPGLQIFSFGHYRKTAENARNSPGPARFPKKPAWFRYLREDFTTGNGGREWYSLKGGERVSFALHFSHGASHGLIGGADKIFTRHFFASRNKYAGPLSLISWSHPQMFRK